MGAAITSIFFPSKSKQFVFRLGNLVDQHQRAMENSVIGCNLQKFLNFIKISVVVDFCWWEFRKTINNGTEKASLFIGLLKSTCTSSLDSL